MVSAANLEYVERLRERQQAKMMKMLADEEVQEEQLNVASLLNAHKRDQRLFIDSKSHKELISRNGVGLASEGEGEVEREERENTIKKRVHEAADFNAEIINRRY